MMKSFMTGIVLLVFSGGALAQEAGSESGLEAWARIYEVVSHPRCSNCHVGEDNRPRWSGAHYGLEDGDSQFHGMYIHGGEDRIGAETLMCSTCHQSKNSEKPHGPPGAPVWSLPPAEMAWFGVKSAEVCEQIKDPERNGDRSLADLASHIGHDELVAWGWNPGGGREPAPYSARETMAFVETWAKAGAPCPVQ